MVMCHEIKIFVQAYIGKYTPAPPGEVYDGFLYYKRLKGVVVVVVIGVYRK